MKRKKFLQVATICFCATTMFLCGSNLFAGTIIYQDSFEVSDGYTFSYDTSIVDQQGWRLPTGATNVSATLRDNVPTDGAVVMRLCVQNSGTTTNAAVLKDIVATEITDSVVDFWVDAKNYGGYGDFLLGDSTMAFTSSTDLNGVGPMFGFNTGANFRLFEGSTQFGASDPDGSTAYTFHAVVDYATDTYRLEIFKTSDNSLVVGFDDWVSDTDPHDKGDYDAFAFRDSNVTGFKTLGIRDYTNQVGQPMYVDNIIIEETVAVPEPSTVAMLLAGLMALGMVIRKRK